MQTKIWKLSGNESKRVQILSIHIKGDNMVCFVMWVIRKVYFQVRFSKTEKQSLEQIQTH